MTARINLREIERLATLAEADPQKLEAFHKAATPAVVRRMIVELRCLMLEDFGFVNNPVIAQSRDGITIIARDEG